MDPSLLSVPARLASTGDPVDGNPYPPEAPQYRLWVEATQRAAEAAVRLEADWMAAMHALNWPRATSFDELEARVLAQRTKHRELSTALFQTWATRGASVVLNDADVERMDHWLVGYADACLKAEAALMASHRAPAAALDEHLRYLRDTFTMLVLHYKAEARRVLSLRRAESKADAPATAPTKPKAHRRFPSRARWLQGALQARKWTVRDLERYGGPDARTVRKALRGESVGTTVLDKLALALSTKGPVTLADIPDD